VKQESGSTRFPALFYFHSVSGQMLPAFDARGRQFSIVLEQKERIKKTPP
jgi:hypothetical protein